MTLLRTDLSTPPLSAAFLTVSALVMQTSRHTSVHFCVFV